MVRTLTQTLSWTSSEMSNAHRASQNSASSPDSIPTSSEASGKTKRRIFGRKSSRTQEANDGKLPNFLFRGARSRIYTRMTLNNLKPRDQYHHCRYDRKRRGPGRCAQSGRRIIWAFRPSTRSTIAILIGS